MVRLDREDLLFGLGGLALGAVLIFLGFNVLGPLGGTLWDIVAGTVVVVGMSVAVIAAFVWLLPPLLPAR